jgi:hypothetical protein
MFDSFAVEMSLQPDSEDVTRERAKRWLPHLERHRVDFTRLPEIYDELIDNRAMKKMRGDYVGPLSVEDFLAAWMIVRQRPARNPETKASRLIEAQATTPCIKCLGTNYERIFDRAGNYLRTSDEPSCDHQVMMGQMSMYLNDPEASDYYEKYKDELPCDFSTFRKETGFDPKAIHSAEHSIPRREPQPVGTALQCSSCKRRVNTLDGWATGDVCNRLSEGPTPDGSPLLCQGQMVTATARKEDEG